MIDIVIPYKPSYSGNAELKWCLLSIKKHLTNVGRIFVIGPDPKIEGVVHISAKDEPEYSKKERNVFNKLIIACNDKRISSPFLYMNDDHYLLQKYNAETFPFYCSESFGGVGLYKNTIDNTIFYLEESMNYDIHCPIRIYKGSFKKLEQYNWERKFGFLIKSLYMKYVGGVVEKTTDLKIIDPALNHEEILDQLDGRKWFSTGDHMFRGEGIKKVMQQLYE